MCVWGGGGLYFPGVSASDFSLVCVYLYMCVCVCRVTELPVNSSVHREQREGLKVPHTVGLLRVCPPAGSKTVFDPHWFRCGGLKQSVRTGQRQLQERP